MRITDGRTLCVVILLGVTAGARGDPIEDTLAATFRIFSGQSSATCFLVEGPPRPGERVAPTVLVTAAHFLDGAAGEECQVVFRSLNADGSYARREASVPIRDGDRPLWVAQENSDVAALRIVLPKGATTREVKFESLLDGPGLEAGRLRVGADVFVAGYPAKLEANPAGWPVLRKGIVASHPLAPVRAYPTMLIDAKTFGGDSGAPIITVAGGKATVVGLVIGMQRQTDRVTLPFEEKTMHTPLGLAIAVPAALVRDVVEKLTEKEVLVP